MYTGHVSYSDSLRHNQELTGFRPGSDGILVQFEKRRYF